MQKLKVISLSCSIFSRSDIHKQNGENIENVRPRKCSKYVLPQGNVRFFRAHATRRVFIVYVHFLSEIIKVINQAWHQRVAE